MNFMKANFSIMITGCMGNFTVMKLPRNLLHAWSVLQAAVAAPQGLRGEGGTCGQKAVDACVLSAVVAVLPEVIVDGCWTPSRIVLGNLSLAAICRWPYTEVTPPPPPPTVMLDSSSGLVVLDCVIGQAVR